MRHFVWSDVSESAMPALSGSVLRRFVSGEKLTVAKIVFGPNSATSEHRHENEQMAVVLEGTLIFTVDGAEVIVDAGEALLLSADEWHGARSGPGGATVLDIFAPPRRDWETV